MDRELEHALIAGTDMLLVPSRVEPCGVHQLCALRYGTVPVVHSVGGLADTVAHAGPPHLEAGTANGFRFDDYTASALDAVLHEACDTYQRQPAVWRQLVTNGMRQDWSWKASAAKYVQLYRNTVAQTKQTVCA